MHHFLLYCFTFTFFFFFAFLWAFTFVNFLFLIVWPFLFCLGEFFSICCKASLVVPNSFSFCLSVIFFFYQMSMRALLCPVFLALVSFLSSLWIYHVNPFCPAEFLLINKLITLWEFSCMIYVAFVFFLLIFVTLITICLSLFCKDIVLFISVL